MGIVMVHDAARAVLLSRVVDGTLTLDLHVARLDDLLASRTEIGRLISNRIELAVSI